MHFLFLFYLLALFALICTFIFVFSSLFQCFTSWHAYCCLNLGQIAHTHLSISSNRSILLITQGGFYMETVYIVGAVRTAIGKYGGSLKNVPAHTLAAEVMKEAVKRARDPAGISLMKSSSAKSVRVQRHQILHDLLFSKPVSRRRFQASQSTGSVPLPCRQ